MNITDIIRSNSGETISVEIEPPSLGVGIGKLWETLDQLVVLGISWVDITYHAQRILGIDTAGAPIYGTLKPGTGYVAAAILERYRSQQITVVPHIICTGFTARETEELLVGLSYVGVKNVLALRGDPPKGVDGKFLPFIPEPSGHAHASGLITQIANLRQGKYIDAQEGTALNFCIGGACYPEGYGSQPISEQVHWLKQNQERGADYFVTQVFFDTPKYLRFRDSAVKGGITASIIPGIQPLVSVRYLETMPPLFGCSIPPELESRVRGAANASEICRIGVEWCIRQAEELRREGVPGLHFYANRNQSVAEVIRALK